MESFAQLVKNEIIKNIEKKCCEKSFLTGYLRYNSKIILRDQKLTLLISSSAKKIIDDVFLLLEKFIPELSTISVLVEEKKYNWPVYSILINDKVKNILEKFNVIQNNNVFQKKISLNTNWNRCCVRSYFAAIFICKGSVNSPKTSNYHLEMQFNNEQDNETGEYLLLKLKKYSFDFKSVIRKKNYVIYLKQAVQISDFIKFIKANQAMFVFEDSRILRDMANSVVRLNNIDHSNNNRLKKASEKQILQINFLKKQNLFEELSDKIKKLANLRLSFPEASFNELTVLMLKEYNIEISRSGINHYFRKITDLYNKNN
ncbi:DNA-binding protein WhiA [Spiroplasma endosymbiont of Amphibalanus improvisus]|uniref:DNA-binding protein WhiA n=1 Tax=Spiroplasma endosymbiont of Amphibalanus improvisus TaxID=3066327 RepID=UPI00313A778F